MDNCNCLCCYSAVGWGVLFCSSVCEDEYFLFEDYSTVPEEPNYETYAQRYAKSFDFNEIELATEEEDFEARLPFSVTNCGKKARDGRKRVAHLNFDLEEERFWHSYAGVEYPGRRQFLKRNASKARRRLDKQVICGLAA